MCDVFVAEDKHGKLVALRSVKEPFRKRKFLKNFYRGIEVLSRLRHPNVVKIFTWRVDKKNPYSVTELLDAKNIRELMTAQDDLLTNKQFVIIQQLAQGLSHIHKRGYLHLDIKPENIMVMSSGHISIIDFDLARPWKKRALKMRILPGTPSYLAPETLKKKRVSIRTDIFAFGLTCYEILTAHKAFEADSMKEMLANQMDPQKRHKPMSTYRENIPHSLEKIVGKCLAKDPKSRYPSMGLVVRDLERIL